MLSRPVLVLCAAPLLLAFAAAAAACGDDDASADGGSNSGDGSSSPALKPPANRFSINIGDLEPGYLTDIEATYVLDVDNYSKTATFPSKLEGETLLKQWRYVGGFETGYIPEGRESAVLNGAYYINLETHMFEDADGAKKAFDYFENRLRSAQAAQPVSSQLVGNQSSAWKTVAGKVRNTQVDAAYHRIVLRRGNIVAVVMTYGADPFMKVDLVGGLAQIVDDKALGQRQLVEPTPISNFATPTFTPRSPTPNVTPTR